MTLKVPPDPSREECLLWTVGIVRRMLDHLPAPVFSQPYVKRETAWLELRHLRGLHPTLSPKVFRVSVPAALSLTSYSCPQLMLSV